MTTRQEFIDAIKAAPFDARLQSLYADWLDENGEISEDDLAERIESILDGEGSYGFSSSYLNIDSHDRAVAQISYGGMYRAPVLNFKKLLELRDLFGTDGIDVDDYAISGCESCDHGSDYGHRIQIYNPTKNAAPLIALIGRVIRAS